MVFKKKKFLVGIDYCSPTLKPPEIALVTWIVCVQRFSVRHCCLLCCFVERRKTDQNPPGHIDGNMPVGPLVRYHTFLVAISESLISMLLGRAKDIKPSEGEDANEQLQNLCESRRKQSLTCHARVKWNSVPAKCLHSLCEGLRKRQWTRKLRKSLCQQKTWLPWKAQKNITSVGSANARNSVWPARKSIGKITSRDPAGRAAHGFDIAPLRRLMNYRAFPDQSLIGSCALADLESKM